jgi:hypothetical protein
MGTITAASVISKAQIILQDTTGVRWPSDTELLGWLNDGQREVMVYKPNANAKNMAIKLATGTKQSLPDDGVQLIDVVRNMGTNGTTPGRSIRIVMREILDAQVPDWHFSAANAVAKHYTYSMLDPKTFYVYPPQPASNQGYVEMVYGATPTDATINGVINIDDIYQNALIDYILYRAYSKDTEYAADSNRADKHQTAYIASLTGKAKAEIGVNPNSTSPANPNVSARGPE